MSIEHNYIESFYDQVDLLMNEKTNKMTQFESAVVVKVHEDNSIDIKIPPGEVIFHNIQNQSIFQDLHPGDAVVVVKQNNEASNMWIIGKHNIKDPGSGKFNNSFYEFQKMHLHVAYAHNPQGDGFTFDGSLGRAYMGHYTDEHELASTDPGKYTWILVQGIGERDRETWFFCTNEKYTLDQLKNADNSEDGKIVWINEQDLYNQIQPGHYVYTKTIIKYNLGIPDKIQYGIFLNGEKGENGVSSYLHIRYSNDGGLNFTTDENGKNTGLVPGLWVGLAQTQSSTPPTEVARYKWQRIAAYSGYVSSDTDVFYCRTDEEINVNNEANIWSTKIPTNIKPGVGFLTTKIDATFVDDVNDNIVQPEKVKVRTIYDCRKVGTDDESCTETGKYIHIKYSNNKTEFIKINSDGQYDDPDPEYVGFYKDDKCQNSTTVSDYTWLLLKSMDIKSDNYSYYVSKAPMSEAELNALQEVSWQSAMPFVSEGEYLYTRITTIYTDERSQVRYEVTRVGKDGVDGQGVLWTITMYAVTDDTSNHPEIPANINNDTSLDGLLEMIKKDDPWKQTVPEQTSQMACLWQWTHTHYQTNVSGEKCYTDTFNKSLNGLDGINVHVRYATSMKVWKKSEGQNENEKLFILYYKEGRTEEQKPNAPYSNKGDGNWIAEKPKKIKLGTIQYVAYKFDVDGGVKKWTVCPEKCAPSEEQGKNEKLFILYYGGNGAPEPPQFNGNGLLDSWTTTKPENVNNQYIAYKFDTKVSGAKQWTVCLEKNMQVYPSKMYKHDDLKQNLQLMQEVRYIGYYEGVVASDNAQDYIWSEYCATEKYIHIKYSNDGGKTFTQQKNMDAGEAIGTYIGEYRDNNPMDSTNVEDYTWRRSGYNCFVSDLQTVQAYSQSDCIKYCTETTSWSEDNLVDPGDIENMGQALRDWAVTGGLVALRIKCYGFSQQAQTKQTIPNNTSDKVVGAYYDSIQRIVSVTKENGKISGVVLQPESYYVTTKMLYEHVAYCNNLEDNNLIFNPKKGQKYLYMGRYTDFIEKNSDIKNDYFWFKIGQEEIFTVYNKDINQPSSPAAGENYLSGGWHTELTGSDNWRSQKTSISIDDSTEWSAPILIKPKQTFKVYNSAQDPKCPDAGTSYPEQSNGWHTAVQNNDLWCSEKTGLAINSEDTWSTPYKIRGEDGNDGLTQEFESVERKYYYSLYPVKTDADLSALHESNWRNTYPVAGDTVQHYIMEGQELKTINVKVQIGGWVHVRTITTYKNPSKTEVLYSRNQIAPDLINNIIDQYHIKLYRTGNEAKEEVYKIKYTIKSAIPKKVGDSLDWDSPISVTDEDFDGSNKHLFVKESIEIQTKNNGPTDTIEFDYLELIVLSQSTKDIYFEQKENKQYQLKSDDNLCKEAPWAFPMYYLQLFLGDNWSFNTPTKEIQKSLDLLMTKATSLSSSLLIRKNFYLKTGQSYVGDEQELAWGDLNNIWMQTVVDTVTNAQQIINEQRGSIASVVEKVQEIETSNQEFDKTIKTLEQKTELIQTPDQIEAKIKEQIDNGIEYTTGCKLDREGLTISQGDVPTTSLINADGLFVQHKVSAGSESGSTETESLLSATKSGVDAKNLHASTYLIIGTNSRLEDCNVASLRNLWPYQDVVRSYYGPPSAALDVKPRVVESNEYYFELNEKIKLGQLKFIFTLSINRTMLSKASTVQVIVKGGKKNNSDEFDWTFIKTMEWNIENSSSDLDWQKHSLTLDLTKEDFQLKEQDVSKEDFQLKEQDVSYDKLSFQYILTIPPPFSGQQCGIQVHDMQLYSYAVRERTGCFWIGGN